MRQKEIVNDDYGSLKKKLDSTELSKIEADLENLALQLLKDNFYNINSDAYYQVADAYIRETLRNNKQYQMDIVKNKPTEALTRLSIDTIALTYVLISRIAKEKEIKQLLSNYEEKIAKYLETGHLTPRRFKTTNHPLHEERLKIT